MKKKNSGKVGFFVKLGIILCVVLSIFVGGYFFLDKLIVPKYFGDYGIYSISDLVGVVSSLYSTPNESKLITNGYTQTDLSNAISKLQKANYKIESDGTILEDNMFSFKGDKQVLLSDKEVASVCEKLIENGMLENSLPDLNYLNIINISVLELIIAPDEKSLVKEEVEPVAISEGEGEEKEEEEEEKLPKVKTYTKASVEFIMKISTEDIREQISEQMKTPMYLLKIIIPNTLYFTVNFEVDLNAEDKARTTGTIAINGKTEKQSEVLINLLIDFIFPEEDNMNMDGFTRAVGDVVLKGIDELGNFKFISKKDSGVGNGILLN